MIRTSRYQNQEVEEWPRQQYLFENYLKDISRAVNLMEIWRMLTDHILHIGFRPCSLLQLYRKAYGLRHHTVQHYTILYGFGFPSFDIFDCTSIFVTFSTSDWLISWTLNTDHCWRVIANYVIDCKENRAAYCIGSPRFLLFSPGSPEFVFYLRHYSWYFRHKLSQGLRPLSDPFIRTVARPSVHHHEHIARWPYIQQLLNLRREWSSFHWIQSRQWYVSSVELFSSLLSCFVALKLSSIWEIIYL